MSKQQEIEIEQKLGLRVQIARKMKNISQTRLAEHLGLTFQQIQKYEKGTNRISASRLLKIAQFLDVPVVSFYGIEEKTKRKKTRANHSDLDHFTSPNQVDMLAIMKTLSPQENKILLGLARVLKSQKTSF